MVEPLIMVMLDHLGSFKAIGRILGNVMVEPLIMVMQWVALEVISNHWTGDGKLR